MRKFTVWCVRIGSNQRHAFGISRDVADGEWGAHIRTIAGIFGGDVGVGWKAGAGELHSNGVQSSFNRTEFGTMGLKIYNSKNYQRQAECNQGDNSFVVGVHRVANHYAVVYHI